jgi:hypothetical protein
MAVVWQSAAARTLRLLRHILADDAGQDLVEYAYLALFVGLAGAAVWGVTVSLIAQNYDNAMNPDTGVQFLADPPLPDVP